jgi:hypothetical protein
MGQMKPKDALKAVQELEASAGWAYAKQAMQDDILRAAYNIAESPNMTLEEINFRRGAMWAARRLLELPVALRLRLENDVLMEAAMSKEAPGSTIEPPATAGM